MTNHHPTRVDHEITQLAELQSEPIRRQQIRRVAIVGTDGSRFRLVAAPTKRSQRGIRGGLRDRERHPEHRATV
jgi:hypothetical protein